MREEPETMLTGLEFEYLLKFIYGSRCHGIPPELHLKSWRRDLIRLFGTIQRAIEKNVNGDEHHKAHMVELCQWATENIRTAKCKDHVNCHAITSVFKLVFELLGRMPDNWRDRRPHHSRVTELSDYRTLSYTRTAKQRAREITHSAHRNKLGTDDPAFEVLIDKLHDDFRDDPHKFLKWIKTEHPALYRRFE